MLIKFYEYVIFLNDVYNSSEYVYLFVLMLLVRK